MRIGVLHGPNLNYLSNRDKKVYGGVTQKSIIELLKEHFPEDEILFMQSNHEGELIDQLYRWEGETDGVIINAGALTHYSLALRDAIESLPAPVIEVHISNIYAREEFRNRSVLAPVCVGQITGLGAWGYLAAMHYLRNNLKKI